MKTPSTHQKPAQTLQSEITRLPPFFRLREMASFELVVVRVFFFIFSYSFPPSDCAGVDDSFFIGRSSPPSGIPPQTRVLILFFPFLRRGKNLPLTFYPVFDKAFFFQSGDGAILASCKQRALFFSSTMASRFFGVGP